MLKQLGIVLLVCVSLQVQAQRYYYTKKTLLRGGGLSGSVGYVGLGARYAQFNQKNAMYACLDMGWNITDRWLIGFTGAQMVSKIQTKQNYYDKALVTLQWENRYAEYKLAYTAKTYMLLHPVFGLGFGGAEVKNRVIDKDAYQFYNASITYCAFINPYAEMELNISKWCRASACASYFNVLYQTNQNSYISNKRLSSPTVSLMLRFGEF